MTGFMFSTGIENSYPTISGGIRIDQMEKCGHYKNWELDFQLVRDLGLHYLRWGPPLHKTFVRPEKYEWDWCDACMIRLRELDVHPILDLCHFGVPDWIGNFQNRDFPGCFAEYARACAERYPDVKYWTPVNEILITALFSAKYGWWNEQLTSDRSFVQATLNLCTANLLAMQQIIEVIPDAIFVQSESSEYTHASRPDMLPAARFFNERRLD